MHSSHSKANEYSRRKFIKIASTTGAVAAAYSFLPCLAFTHEEAQAAAKISGENVVPTFCGMCGPRDVVCGVYAFSKDGVFTRVAGMKEFPKTSFRSFSVSCQHCAKPWCMEVYPVKAISKAENGVVTVNQEKCIGCQSCLKACPFGVPQFSKKNKPAKMQKCDMCINELYLSKDEPPCVATCNTKALGIKKLTPEEKQANEQKLMKVFS